MKKNIIFLSIFFLFLVNFNVFAFNSNALPSDIIMSDSYNDTTILQTEQKKTIKEEASSLNSSNKKSNNPTKNLENFTDIYNKDTTQQTAEMNKRFDEYIKRKKESSVFVLVGINEFVKGDTIDEAFSLGARFSHRNDSFLIALPHVYPVAVLGSKGLTMNLFSYAVMDTDFLKLYADPIIPFIHWDGEISLASGGTIGIYGKKIGLEFNYKHLWTSPYKNTDDGKEYSDFWGLYFVYRY
jgi:hypothetical protein